MAAFWLSLAGPVAGQSPRKSIDPNNLANTATLTFSDEFESLSLWNGKSGVWDTAYWWAHPNGTSVPTNDEKQWYINATFGPTSFLRPWAVSNGILTLTARPADGSVRPLINGYAYTSGMLTTLRSFSQTYGYFEIRAKLPAGKGVWPAFWLLPADRSWPPEIDVLEVLGHDPATVYMTVHSNATGSHTEAQGKITGHDTSSGFHTYGAAWGPETITWYMDGKPTFTAPTPPDAHKPFYILVNLAIGGKWPGDPDGTTPFPAVIEIDYIRAYRER